MDEGGIPQREDLRKLKVVQLRHMLSEASLPQSGLKEALITRLIEHYAEQQATKKADAEQEVVGEPSDPTETGEDGRSPEEEEEAMEVGAEEEGGVGERGAEVKEEELVVSLPAEGLGSAEVKDKTESLEPRAFLPVEQETSEVQGGKESAETVDSLAVEPQEKEEVEAESKSTESRPTEKLETTGVQDDKESADALVSSWTEEQDAAVAQEEKEAQDAVGTSPLEEQESTQLPEEKESGLEEEGMEVSGAREEPEGRELPSSSEAETPEEKQEEEVTMDTTSSPPVPSPPEETEPQSKQEPATVASPLPQPQDEAPVIESVLSQAPKSPKQAPSTHGEGAGDFYAKRSDLGAEPPTEESSLPQPRDLQPQPHDPEPQPAVNLAADDAVPETKEVTTGRDSGLDEPVAQPREDSLPTAVPAHTPPPVSTTSDYFSDSTKEEEPVRASIEPVATSFPVPGTAPMAPSSRPPPLMSQMFPSSRPQVPSRALHIPPAVHVAPPSLSSIPLPSQPPPQSTRSPLQTKPPRPPAVTTEKGPETESKGKRKKKRRRRRRQRASESGTNSTAVMESKDEPEVEIEYVQEDILQPGDPNYRQFHKIFEMFKISEPEEKPETQESPMELVAKAVEASKKMAAAIAAERKHDSSDEEEEPEKEKEAPKISKKKLRKLNRLSVAQLKQLVERPDVVEMHDVTAQDPRLLIHLKSTRNTVSVPRHWCFKRKYLQGKRGIEKPPFDLPDFIKATGIMEMRQALEDKEDAKSLKQKTRERVRPKMGKLTIDYQKLHDAFFKWQTKPKMSIHGDLYYEGKEFETRLREKKPGDLSDELRRSLGMPTGQGKQKFPPPWLVAMQRYGPPPSYPNLKIPGLNAPIPEGCSFGYFVGGWGKPPVDETGRPLYGDVFGLDQGEAAGAVKEEEVDETLWGEMESEESEEEESSEEEEDKGEEAPKPEEIQAGLITPMEGLVTPSGLTSIPAGLETPEMIQLRKRKIEEAMEQGGETPVLYTVLPEKPTAVGAAMMGSAHVYDIAAAIPGAVKKTGSSGTEGVEVALDPSELDLDTATMTARYEEQLREHLGAIQKEDLSDMVAEHAAKQKKRKRAATDTGGKASKKLKEFKF